MKPKIPIIVISCLLLTSCLSFQDPVISGLTIASTSIKTLTVTQIMTSEDVDGLNELKQRLIKAKTVSSMVDTDIEMLIQATENRLQQLNGE